MSNKRNSNNNIIKNNSNNNIDINNSNNIKNNMYANNDICSSNNLNNSKYGLLVTSSNKKDDYSNINSSNFTYNNENNSEQCSPVNKFNNIQIIEKSQSYENSDQINNNLNISLNSLNYLNNPNIYLKNNINNNFSFAKRTFTLKDNYCNSNSTHKLNGDFNYSFKNLSSSTSSHDAHFSNQRKYYNSSLKLNSKDFYSNDLIKNIIMNNQYINNLNNSYGYNNINSKLQSASFNNSLEDSLSKDIDNDIQKANSKFSNAQLDSPNTKYKQRNYNENIIDFLENNNAQHNASSNKLPYNNFINNNHNDYKINIKPHAVFREEKNKVFSSKELNEVYHHSKENNDSNDKININEHDMKAKNNINVVNDRISDVSQISSYSVNNHFNNEKDNKFLNNNNKCNDFEGNQFKLYLYYFWNDILCCRKKFSYQREAVSSLLDIKHLLTINGLLTLNQL